MYNKKYKDFFKDEDLVLLKNILVNNNNNNNNVLKIKKILIPLKIRDLYYDDLVQLLNIVNENTCIYYEFYKFQCYMNADKFTHFQLSKISNFIEKYKWYDLNFDEINEKIFNGNLKIKDFKKIKKIIYKPIKYYRDFIKLRDILLKCLYDPIEFKESKIIKKNLNKFNKNINNIFTSLTYINFNIYIIYGNIWLKKLEYIEFYYLYKIFNKNKIKQFNFEKGKYKRSLYLNLNLNFLLIKNINKIHKYINWYNNIDFLEILIDEIDNDEEYIYINFEPQKYVNLFYLKNCISIDLSTSSDEYSDYSDDNELNYLYIFKENQIFFNIKLNLNNIKLLFLFKNNSFFFNIYNLKYFNINESDYDNIEDNYIYCMEKYICNYENYPVYFYYEFDLINTFGIHMEHKFILGNKNFLYLIWEKIWINNDLIAKIRKHAISWSYDWEDNLYWYRESGEFNDDLINKFYFYKIKLDEKKLYINIYKQKFNISYQNILVKNNYIYNNLINYKFNKFKIKKNIFYLNNYIYLLNIYNLYYKDIILLYSFNKYTKIIFYVNNIFRKNKYIISCQLFWKFYMIMLFFMMLYIRDNNYIYMY